jgi:hypothetical protein
LGIRLWDRATVAERELISIVWHRNAPNVIQRIYANGPLERISGNRALAEEMAENEGFGLVPTPVHLIKWVKDPESWHVGDGE